MTATSPGGAGLVTGSVPETRAGDGSDHSAHIPDWSAPCGPAGLGHPCVGGGPRIIETAGAEHASAVVDGTADEERIREVLHRTAVIRADTARIQQGGVVQSPVSLSSAIESPLVLPGTGPRCNITPVSPHGTPINFSVMLGDSSVVSRAAAGRAAGRPTLDLSVWKAPSRAPLLVTAPGSTEVLFSVGTSDTGAKPSARSKRRRKSRRVKKAHDAAREAMGGSGAR